MTILAGAVLLFVFCAGVFLLGMGGYVSVISFLEDDWLGVAFGVLVGFAGLLIASLPVVVLVSGGVS
ncbi:hypothetical protein ACOI8T_09195 [Bifidobacterium breve]|uniref:hypothetical protein n=1 Tax=Bifidobacterium TaxID=1678 RepID=UPI00195D81AD|nr:hypothetical protein [Bifidobacterium longum]VTX81163.1 Uncharacterised protein [Bifidobacterium longum]